MDEIEQWAAAAKAAEAAGHSAEEAAGWTQREREDAEERESSRRDGVDYHARLMEAPYPQGVHRVRAQREAADAEAAARYEAWAQREAGALGRIAEARQQEPEAERDDGERSP